MREWQCLFLFLIRNRHCWLFKIKINDLCFFFNNSNKLFYYNIRSRERRFTSCPHAGYFLKTIMLWWAEGNVFVQSPSLSHTLHVYMCLHAITYSHACIHMVFSPKNKMQTHSQTHKHTHSQTHTRATFLDSELRQPIISFNPFIMFLFSFPPVWGKKRWMQTGIPAYKEKHTASGWENKSREFFGERRDACVPRVRMCASLFGEKKRGGIVQMIALHACICECVICVVSSACWSVDRGVVSLSVTGSSEVRRVPITRCEGPSGFLPAPNLQVFAHFCV